MRHPVFWNDMAILCHWRLRRVRFGEWRDVGELSVNNFLTQSRDDIPIFDYITRYFWYYMILTIF